MKKWLILLVLMVFASEAFAEMRVEMPVSVKQGGVIKIMMEDDNLGMRQVEIKHQHDEKFHVADIIYLDSARAVALIPIRVSHEPENLTVCVWSSKKICGEIEIQKVDFPESKRVFPVAKPTPAVWARFQKERAFLDEIYARVTPEKYFSEHLQFANPLEKMEIVPNSDFGQIRKKVLVNPKTRKVEDRWKDYHKGADFRASTGTPVFAAEGGKIVAARNLLGSGNTVIIDHGYGLISLYFHLSKIYLKEGAEVRRGQKIGLAGMSGNAEGPHLHFEIRLHKIPVNPFEFFGDAK